MNKFKSILLIAIIIIFASCGAYISEMVLVNYTNSPVKIIIWFDNDELPIPQNNKPICIDSLQNNYLYTIDKGDTLLMAEVGEDIMKHDINFNKIVIINGNDTSTIKGKKLISQLFTKKRSYAIGLYELGIY